MSDNPFIGDPDFPTKERKNVTQRIAFGYIPSPEDPLVLIPDPDLSPYIKEAFDFIDDGGPFRTAAQWLTEKCGRSISHQGIKRIWEDRRGDPKTNPRAKAMQKQAKARKPKTPADRKKAEIKTKLSQAKRLQTIRQKQLDNWLEKDEWEAQYKAEKEGRPIEDIRDEMITAKEADETPPEPVAPPKPTKQPATASPSLPDDLDVVFRPNPGPQTEFLAAPEREVLYGGSAGGGKMLLYQALILTPFGWRKMEDLKVGSTICSVDGSTTKIIGYYPQPVKPFYRLTFADGAVVDCCEDHLWLLHTAGTGRKIKGNRVFGPEARKIWTTHDIYTHYQKENSRLLGTPIADPVVFTVSGQKKGPKRFIKRDLDPYTLGVLLGDGCISTKNVTITSMDGECVSRVEAALGESFGYHQKLDSKAASYRVPARLVWDHLDDLGLAGTTSKNKFIPRIYKLASEEERWSLLQGLMDTDGCAEKDGDATFCSISETLADDVRELARSLGCWVSKRSKEAFYLDDAGDRVFCNTAYELRIKCRTPEKLFHIFRKKERVRGKQYQSMANWIVSIEAIEPSDGACIAVDHPSRLFITDEYVVTHNSYAMLADPMRYFDNKNYAGILFRRTNDELRELIWKSQEIYPRAFPGAKWQEKKSQWVFPSGARLWLTYLERDEDVLRYQGQAFSWIGFDEITQYPTPFAFDYMRSRLRSTDPSLPLSIRATTNPGGPGHGWVKRMFIDPSPPNTAFPAKDINTGEDLIYPPTHEKAGQPLFYRRFIPASLYDNPYLSNDGAYEANLLALPEMQRRQLLEGDWAIADGAAFPEFRPNVHVVEPFDIPDTWRRFRSCDYGYSSFSAVHWFAIDPAYETLVVYRELYVSKHTGKDLAKAVLAEERGERIDYGVLDSSCWHQRGQVGPSIAEEMIAMGCRWRPSDRTNGARINGKNRFHEVLKVDEGTGRPGIMFFNNCRQIIADLPVIPADPRGGEDINPKYASDHAYDSVRYGIMSRPRAFSPFDDGHGVPKQKWRPAVPAFGY